MFVIQFAGGCRIWDVPKNALYRHILASENDIEAVYEQATPVTKRVRKELREAYDSGSIKTATPAARRFFNSPA